MTGDIRFLLNGLTQVVANPDPDLTILEWLRNSRHLTGTKEGCAEGDCGACSVAVGEVVSGRLQLRTINSCIAMVAQLHGKLLVTVEGLARGKTLHPVQQAMVDHHGSQCGFCTPGFVMTLFGQFHENGAKDEAAIHDALAGNLCRCTGYRPIVDAAKDALGGERTDAYKEQEAALVAALVAIGAMPVPKVQGRSGTCFAPASLDELTMVLKDNPQARLIAGGTDLGLEVTKHGRALPLSISLSGVAELKAITETADTLIIGAAATYSDVMPHLEGYGDSAITLLRRLGSTQIRNLGTFGGNIANASPIGDTPPMLLALDAAIELASHKGRRMVPLAEFFTGYRKTVLEPGECVAFIHLPRLKAGETFVIDKISRRFDQDISAVCGAMFLAVADGVITAARIAYGGMAERPKLAPKAMAALTGQPLTMASFEAAAVALAQDFAPIDDFRASAGYRMTVAQNLIRRRGLLLTGARQEAAE